MPPARVTIRQLAARLALSKSTVSAALAGDHRVRPATRERVVAEAQALGYRPHPHFRILGAQRRQGSVNEGSTIALLMRSADLSRTPRYSTARKRARELGYRTEVWPIDHYPDPLELARILYHRGIQALLLVTGCRFDTGADFPWDHFAVVATGHRTGPATVDRLEHDTFVGMQIAWQKIRAAGWRRIGAYLPFDPPNPTLRDQKRLAAFRFFQEQDSRHQDRLPPLQAPFGQPDPFRHWFETHRPEAVIGITDAPITDQRFLPTNCAPLPFVNLQIGERPRQTAGVRVYGTQAQIAAVDWLDEKMRLGLFGLSSPARTILLEPEWQAGKSFWPRPNVTGRAHHPN